MLKPSLMLAGALAALALPAVASAADVTVVPDPDVASVAALDGTIVWIRHASSGLEVLMKRDAHGVARVPDAPAASAYVGLTAGRDARGRLSLTYQRCTKYHCGSELRDDLHGHRAIVHVPDPAHCQVSSPVASWRRRIAYGELCKAPPGHYDPKRSGVYVSTAGGAPRRLRMPPIRGRRLIVRKVVLRGTLVGAVADDSPGGPDDHVDLESAFTQTIDGRDFRELADASVLEQLALAPAGVTWELSSSAQPSIVRLAPGCREVETLAATALQEFGGASALAVAGSQLYGVVPGAGIVSHTFTPDIPCSR